MAGAPSSTATSRSKNVFVVSCGEWYDGSDAEFKLGDFGLSYYDHEDATLPVSMGTMIYCPPGTLWGDRKTTTGGDIWAVGCVIHVLTYGFAPVVDPEKTAREKEGTIPQDVIQAGLQERYWNWVTPRKPLAINLPSDQQEPDWRRGDRVTPNYGAGLNKCLEKTLEMQEEDRITGPNLKKLIEAKRTPPEQTAEEARKKRKSFPFCSFVKKRHAEKAPTESKWQRMRHFRRKEA